MARSLSHQMILCSALLIWSVPVSAQQGPPLRGTLVGKNDGDLLDYECREISFDRISCSFVQVQLNSRSTPDDLEKSLLGIPDMLEEMKTEADFCKLMEAFDHAKRGEIIADTELRSTVEAAQEERKKLSASDPYYYERTGAIESALVELCKSPNEKTARNYLEVTHNLSADICEPMFNRYTQEFVKVSDNLWVVESSPYGECGAVNTSRFNADSKYPSLWNYEASKIITNKEGGTIMPCNVFDESPQPYFWNQGPVLKNCKYLD